MRREFARLIAMFLLVIHGAGGLAPRVVCVAEGACVEPRARVDVCCEECEREARQARCVSVCALEGFLPSDPGGGDDERCDCCRRLPVPGDARVPLPQVKLSGDADWLAWASLTVVAMVGAETRVVNRWVHDRSPGVRARDEALSLRTTRLLI